MCMWFFLKKSMLLDFFVLSSTSTKKVQVLLKVQVQKKNNVGNVLNEFVVHANLKYFIKSSKCNEIKHNCYDESCWSFKGN